jgi:hypothetical protein
VGHLLGVGDDAGYRRQHQNTFSVMLFLRSAISPVFTVKDTRFFTVNGEQLLVFSGAARLFKIHRTSSLIVFLYMITTKPQLNMY